MNMAGVLARESLYKPADRDIRDLYHEMYSIRLPGECVHECPASLQRAGEKPFEVGVVVRLRKDVPARVTTQGNVVDPSWYVQS